MLQFTQAITYDVITVMHYDPQKVWGCFTNENFTLKEHKARTCHFPIIVAIKNYCKA